MYVNGNCSCEQAAWRVYDLMCEHEPMYFEAHLTEDFESPNGYGWYYSSHARQADGTWDEYDGGIYWDYENADEFEGVIAEAVPFSEFEAKRVEYEEFEEAMEAKPISLEERAAMARLYQPGRENALSDRQEKEAQLGK